MYGNTTLIQQQIVNGSNGRIGSAAQVRQAMTQKFWRVRLGAALSALWTRLRGGRFHPRSLVEMTDNRRVTGRRHLGLQIVPLNQVVGSEGRVNDFDPEFRPLRSHNRERWIGIATARSLGATLPPVELVQVGEGYFVRDGNHRVSVARSEGQTEIDAVVTQWQVA